MKYSASYDSGVKIITTLTILLLTSIAIKLIYDMMHIKEDMISILTLGFAIIVMAGIIIACYIYSPQYYTLNANDLQIKRIINNRTIPFSEISEIRLLEKEELRGIIRVFGVGGLFGYFGKFRSSKLGTMNFYATQSNNKILIVLKAGEKIVITPDDISIIAKIQMALIN